jgi:uncharacterized protein YbjT (DUF2867 family)
MTMTILVTGATGRVGRHVVRELLAAGARVRAMTRHPDGAGLPEEVEVVAGDLAEPATLRRVLDGVAAMYLFPVPETADEVARLAERAGVQHVVTLSSSSAGTGNEADPNALKHIVVERAIEHAGLSWTHVRPDAFAGNTLMWAQSIKDSGVVEAPFGDAAQAPIHEADVAAVCATAVLTPGHTGETYTLTGPTSLTQREQVQTIGEAIGRQLRFVELSYAQAEVRLGRFLPAVAVETVLRALAKAVDGPAEVLPTVERITGRPARSFAEWAEDNAVEFGSVNQ